MRPARFLEATQPRRVTSTRNLDTRPRRAPSTTRNLVAPTRYFFLIKATVNFVCS
jgi:hypothetical protein